MATPRPPWKAALYAGLGCILIGMVVGTIAIMIVGSDDYYASGQTFGQGLAQLAILVAVVAYFGERRRAKKRQTNVDDVFR